MEVKVCCRCKTEKDVSDFNKKRANKDGLERYCRDCHREHNRAHYTSNKEAYINQSTKRRKAVMEWWTEYKSSLQCEICGEARYWCLDFHHGDPTKKEGTVSSLVRAASRQRLLDEIAKCQVVCRNCHADIHYNMQQ